MDKRASLPVQERILQLLQRLGIEQAHFMGYAPEDWQGLAANHPEVLASLTLFCVPPHRLDPSGLGALASRLLVFTDERNWSSAATDRALRSLQDMTLVPLPGYSAFLWSDLISDRTQEMSAVLLEFLGRIDKSLHLPAVNIPERKGELDGILYRIEGTGPPLVLFPLGLAPSQWDPLVPVLKDRYCTIRLGGGRAGIRGDSGSAWARSRLSGYRAKSDR